MLNYINKYCNGQTLALGKADEYFGIFALRTKSYSMNKPGWGLGLGTKLPLANQITAAFIEIRRRNGFFLFCINGVDLKAAIKGFDSFESAEGNFQITEWELFLILNNPEYLKHTIFHNGTVRFIYSKRKKQFLWKA